MTYQPPFDPNQQPASGPPSYGPPQGLQSQGQQQYGQQQGEHQYGQQQGEQQYGQQQYGASPGQSYGNGQPGYVQQPMQPPKKRKKWPYIVGGIVLASILGCVGLFTLVLGGASKVANNLDENQSGKNAVAGKMGTPATDGKFQFTVTGMKCGVTSVGGEYGQKAQGEFCLVSVNIKNIAKSAETFFDGSQKGYKGDTEYSVDSGAAVFANKDSSTFLEEINPGNTVKGKLVFDVPAGTKLTSVVLHESAFTEGVKIPLK